MEVAVVRLCSLSVVVCSGLKKEKVRTKRAHDFIQLEDMLFKSVKQQLEQFLGVREHSRPVHVHTC